MTHVELPIWVKKLGDMFLPAGSLTIATPSSHRPWLKTLVTATSALCAH